MALLLDYLQCLASACYYQNALKHCPIKDIILMQKLGESFMSKKVYTIEEIKLILSNLLENMPVYKVVLFGSYANNSADSSSDLDFILDTNNTLMGFKLLNLIALIEDAFEKQVDAFEVAEIIEDSRIDKEIRESGVVVYEKQRTNIN